MVWLGYAYLYSGLNLTKFGDAAERSDIKTFN
jgi:hypothetical protein